MQISWEMLWVGCWASTSNCSEEAAVADDLCGCRFCLKLQANAGPSEKGGHTEQQGGGHTGSENAGQAEGEVRSEPRGGSGGDGEVIEIRHEVGEEGIGAGGADEGGPR